MLFLRLALIVLISFQSLSLPAKACSSLKRCKDPECPRRIPQLRSRLKAAANKGSSNAQYRYALMLEKGEGAPAKNPHPNPEEALKYYIKAAEQGHSEAQNVCGIMYSYGIGVEKDEEKGLIFFELATTLNHNRPPEYRGPNNSHFINPSLVASSNLANYILNHKMVERYPEARAHFIKALSAAKASKIEMIQAQEGLAYMYMHGLGGPQDLVEAKKLYEHLVSIGSIGACNNLAFLLSNETSPPLPLVRELYRQAAEKGIKEAQFNLAEMQAKGRGGPQEPEEALANYRLAADGSDGLPSAQFALGFLLSSGHLGEKDPIEAVNYLEIAVEKEFPEAEFALAVMLEKGLGTSQDLKRAYWYYQKAAHQGLQQAIRKLSELTDETTQSEEF